MFVAIMENEEDQLKAIAAQLRKPTGMDGVEVGKMMNHGNLNINLAAMDSLQIKQDDSILEIGMGNGYFACQMIECAERVSYTGFDYSSDMVMGLKAERS
ncbi:MAG: class I SAM-dependent methyltransferase [Flavobacteriales bacterium]